MLTKNSPSLIVILALLLLSVNACDIGESSTDETVDASRTGDESAQESLFTRLANTFSAPEVTVPAGTRLLIRLNQTLDSGENQEGEEFSGMLLENLSVDDTLVAPAGTVVSGRVIHADDADKVKGRGELAIQLTSITVDQETYALSTQPLHFKSEGTKKDDAAVIGGAAGVGALVGALTGGKKGAAIGAAAGGGAGTTYVLITSGKEVRLPAETRIVFTLDHPVELPESR